MESGFEEYYSTKYPNDDCTLMRNGNYSGWIKQQHWEQWQHQQTKVDELQKRVNAALKMISINRGFAWGSVSISQLEQTLKDGSDE